MKRRAREGLILVLEELQKSVRFVKERDAGVNMHLVLEVLINGKVCKEMKD